MKNDQSSQTVVRLDRDGPLATLTVDHPPMNVWTEEVLAQTVDALAALRREPPRGLLIRAAGEMSSAGADVAFFARADQADAAPRTARYLQEITQAVEQLPCPTVAAIHGLCLTAGFEIALACDLVVASRSTKIGLVEAAIGLTPLLGGTQRLAARVGVARAAEIVMSAKIYDAEQLATWGAINRVYDDDGFAEAATRFASRIAQGPTQAHAATKAVLAAFGEGGVPAADRALPDIAARLWATEDLRTGVASFLEHGPGNATFTGR